MADLNNDLEQMLAKLDAEELDLVEAIKKLQIRLNRVRAARQPLAAIKNDDPIEFAGSLTEAVRFVLKSREGSLTAPQLRDHIRAIGYDFSAHKHDNVMANIHGILKRMIVSGEVKTKEWKKEPGVVRYYWQGWDAPTITVPLRGVGATGHVGSVIVGPLMTADEIEAAKKKS